MQVPVIGNSGSPADSTTEPRQAPGRGGWRASLDDFKHPWRNAREHGYDRVSGEGYYRNACDFGSARDLLLQPAVPAA